MSFEQDRGHCWPIPSKALPLAGDVDRQSDLLRRQASRAIKLMSINAVVDLNLMGSYVRDLRTI